MIKMRYIYEDHLIDHYFAYQLIKRKLRTSYIKEQIKTFSVRELRYMYHSIHHKKPLSGQIQIVTTIPICRESFLYLALFVSIYQNTSLVDIESQIDVAAIIFAWDTFCQLFPEHIREKRPFGKIRPANFNEAWVIIQNLRKGMVELQYCTTCHHNFLIVHGCHFTPVCQVCELDKARKISLNSISAYLKYPKRTGKIELSQQ